MLRVSANRATLSDFLSETRLPYCDEHDKTTLRRFGRNKGKPFGHAGFQTWVSRKEWSDMPGQVRDAIRFLRRHRDHLKRLRGEFKARDITLDFPYYLRIGKNDVVIQCDILPATLISLAGELGIGIEMTLYPTPRRSKRRRKVAALVLHRTAAQQVGVQFGRLEWPAVGANLMKDGIDRIVNGLPEKSLGVLASWREIQTPGKVV